MKTVNRTFSIPIDVDRDLHLLIKRRGMSHFVGEVLRKSLQETTLSLSEEYIAANSDPGQKEAYKTWEVAMADGLEEDSEW